MPLTLIAIAILAGCQPKGDRVYGLPTHEGRHEWYEESGTIKRSGDSLYWIPDGGWNCFECSKEELDGIIEYHERLQTESLEREIEAGKKEMQAWEDSVVRSGKALDRVPFGGWISH